jgi:methionine-rich copper-binding protein CopC
VIDVTRRFLWALVAALALVGLAGVAPAAAHIELEASDPAAGAVLPEAPKALSLTFSATPIAVSVDVVGPDGAPVATGEPVRQGPTVVVPLPVLEQAGAYTVNWSAANDAHPFTGTYTVTLDLPTTTTTAPTTTTTTSEVAATDSIPARTSGDDDAGGGGTTAVVVVSGLLLAAAAVVLVVARARSRRRAPTPAG